MRISTSTCFPALFAFVMLTATTVSGADPRPNILLIMADDLGYADVGFNGATDIPTPELDRLASQGTIFSSAYVAHPFCGPSRAALLTGRYPHDIGSQFNLPETGAGPEEGIDVNETMVSTVLQDAGYQTGLVGKWHLGESAKFHPNRRGFDDFFGFLGGGHNYFPDQYKKKYQQAIAAGTKPWHYLLPLEHNGKEVEVNEYLTDALSHHGVRFVEQAAKTEDPFFLFLSYNAPHTPMEAKEEDLAKLASITNTKRRTYAAMVYAMDRGIGEVVAALKQTGQFDSTLIIFLSDNGGRVDQGASNAPLKGVKGDTWEGGYRVPMFFHWPGVVPTGKHFDHPVTAIDFYPTLAGLGKATMPTGKQLAGKDIWSDILAGNNPREGEMIFTLRHYQNFSNVGARRDQWKIWRSGGTKPWSLFNLSEDIGETNDVAGSHPQVVEEMVAQTKEWSQTHIQPRWFDNPGFAEAWKQNEMPHYDTLLSLASTTVAPAMAAPSNNSPAISAANPVASDRKLKKGDSTLSHFVEMEKAKWEKNGWKWNQSKVEESFNQIDTDHDGIASGIEKKLWYAKKKKPE